MLDQIKETVAVKSGMARSTIVEGPAEARGAHRKCYVEKETRIMYIFTSV